MMFALPVTTVSRTRSDATVRLYTLDCGHAEFTDFGLGSDTGDYDGRPAELADPCFLIKHPKGWLLWDAGLPAALPRSVSGGVAPQDMLAKLGFRTWIARPLVDQLADLGLEPRDIDYVAFSHMHFDHVGNANLFTRATWILNRDLHRHVPGGNADRAATLASMDRIEAIARVQHARVVVQHAPEDFARLPKAPRYLE